LHPKTVQSMKRRSFNQKQRTDARPQKQTSSKFGVDFVYVVVYSNLGFDRGTVPYENHGVKNEIPHRSIAPTLGPDGARSIGKWTGLPTSGPSGARTPPIRRGPGSA
jgi:hypothetical protein